ncbi:MAG: FAD-binding protein [Acidobacteria bacterium]|nr:FAD-binding protein [Acidobacteriota bacterium]
MPGEKFDVCVIGSGASGGTLAAELAQRGARVCLVEGGPRREPGRLKTHAWPYEPKSHHGSEPPVRVDADKEPTEYTGDPISILRARVFGGRTTHWNAVALRFSEEDFREGTMHGLEDDWPISYQEVAPYYDKAERLMVVCGSKEGLPEVPDGQFIRPLKLRCSEHILRRASRKFDMRLIPVRKALASEPGHGRANCHFCGHCMMGCGVSAIFNTAEHAIPQGVETGKLEIRAGWMAHELLVDDEARIRSVRVVRTYGKQEDEIQADVFALCCGNIESPRLLLNSKSRRFPNGLANNSDNVGRYLHGHIIAQTVGYLKELVGVKPFNQDGAIDHAYIPRFKPYRKVDFVGGYGFQINIRSYMYPYQAKELEGYGAAWKKQVREMQPAHTILAGYGKVVAQRDNRVTLHPKKKDANGLPVPVVHFRWHENDLAQFRDMRRVAREIYDEAGVGLLFHPNDQPSGFASHEVGVCRMGKDPKTSVLNKYNQAWEVKNLFVTDGSSFTSFPEKNPTLTIAALALRTADSILEMKRRGEL